jgi:uncharacterized iron-regulated membrane protein
MQTSIHSEPVTRKLALQRSLFWRIHFWAALIASPFALLAALTGLVYVFTPQIENVLYAYIDRVAGTGSPLPLDAAVAAAEATAPAGSRLHSVLPAHTASETVEVNFIMGQASAGHAGHTGMGNPSASGAPLADTLLPSSELVVYVDPYMATVVGQLPTEQRFNVWAKKLHSRLLQTDNWRWMIELAASWLMVMLLTGIFLWWPQDWRKVFPDLRLKGRASWRQWHSFIGIVLSVLSFTILATGLTWSEYAGSQFRALRDNIGQAPPGLPQYLQSSMQAGVTPLGWQAVWDIGRQNAPDVAMSLTSPKDPQGTWLLTAVDRSQPDKRFDLALDAYSGQVLYYSGWDQQTAFAKATAIGIPFHRGEFGWWNQALLLLFGAGVLFSLVSGWTMFFKRWQSGSGWLPRLLPGAWKSASFPCLVTAAALCIAMPLLALSSTAVIMVEIILQRNRTGTVT